MLDNTPIICFGKDRGGDPLSTDHIMRILSRENRVLWVNSIGIRRPGANRRDLARLFTKLRRSLDGCVPVAPNVHVFNPLVIPFPERPMVARVNFFLLSAAVRRLSRRIDFDRPIVWSFLPTTAELVGRLGERAFIYHCLDDHAEFSGVARAALRRAERRLVRKADLVFTSSELLWRERVQENARTFFVPHGVNYHHFARAALDPRLTIPDDVAALPRPIIGFFGLIAEYLDLELIAEVARRRPGWSFVMLGRCVTGLQPIRGVANIHLLGQRPYDSLPGYCRAFDAGVIPFRVNALTLRANPLKLREYLAAGLPVVSTPLPEVARYRDFVRVAAGAEAFAGELDHALAERGEPFAGRRVAAMRAESWERRVEEMCGHVRDVLGSDLSRA